MMRNNRFKQTKQKKQTKQTKHKRRMQYGGKIYNCLDYSRILKKDAPEKKVVIPGYAEINDMIKQYKKFGEIQQQLNNGIEGKNVVVYTSCEEIPSTPDTTIILLRKGKATLFYRNDTIDCNDETYLSLASHNFKIFIENILGWNPFLPTTNNHEQTDELQYPHGSRYMYNSRQFFFQFTQESWWDLQEWWNAYKITLPTYASLVPTPTPPPRPRPTPIAMVSSPQEPRDDVSLMDEATVRTNLRILKIHLDGLKAHVIKLEKENQDLRKQIEELQLTRDETKKDK